MIGNNSCGVHALMGGKTVDNIESLDVLLYDGTRMTVGATTEAELAQIIAEGGRRGAIYAGLQAIRAEYADQIRARFPRIPRRVSGYNLDELLPENGFHVARALVGSEGTCATVLGAKLKLVPSPPHRQLVVLGFSDQFLAADAVPRVLEFGPIGLEGFDGLLVDMMRRKDLAVDDLQLLPKGRGYLLVEFGGWTAPEALAQADEFAGQFPGARRFEGQDAARVWRVREQALGAPVFVPGEPHGWEGWEDAAVPPAALGTFLRRLEALMARYGYRSPMYGHFGQGCVHMRINFDLHSASGIADYRAFLDEAADLVLSLGGSLSGEHGDGQARGALLPKMFGPRLMDAFRRFKQLWDPENRMNPGKLIDAYQPTETLRAGEGYRSARPPTHFSFHKDGGSFGEATLRCVGVGACRKETAGVMCPSFMVSGEERHSTRGRAHLLWELMQGDVLGEGWANGDVKEALDGCLSCKACKTECPVNVDVATYKAEFLAQYHRTRPHALRDHVFGRMDRVARWASLAPALANAGLKLPGARALTGRLLGLAPERTLPRFAARPFTRTLHLDEKKRGHPERSGRSSNQKGGHPEQSEGSAFPSAAREKQILRRLAPQEDTFLGANSESGEAVEQGLKLVLLWPDTWNNYFHPQALHAAAAVFADAGVQAWTPKEHVCCGRPLYDFGMLDQARAYLRTILNRFAPAIDAGRLFVFLEPSCASVFRDELLNFFPEDARARALAAQTRLFADALRELAPAWQPGRVAETAVLHGHCHHRALGNLSAELTYLEQACGEVRAPDSGCCGMAGPWGLEQEHYAWSQALGERVLFPAVRRAPAEALVVSGGFSCREQIRQGTGRPALHLAEVFARGLAAS